MADDSTSWRGSRLERRKGVMQLYDSTNQAERELCRGGFLAKR